MYQIERGGAIYIALVAKYLKDDIIEIGTSS
jgi:hypothetical protein